MAALAFSLIQVVSYTTVASASPVPPCADNLIANGGFEYQQNILGFDDNGWGFASDASVDTNVAWFTTDLDSYNAPDHQIEYWKSNSTYSPGLKPPAFEGNQFVELNANSVSALYQDIPTYAGETVAWSLAHRGRDGVDSMTVFAGPPDTNTSLLYGNQLQSGWSELHQDQQGGDLISDSNDAWGVHSGTYVVPAGQTMTRFWFESVASADGDQSMGNLLDNINFGPAYCYAPIPTYDPASTTSTLDGYSFQITNYDPAFSWSVSVPSPATASISNTGLVTVNALPTNYTTVKVRTSSPGLVGGLLSVDGSGINILQPIFDTPTATANGFDVAITNYDPRWNWQDLSVDNPSGTVIVETITGSVETISVTGLGSSGTATLTQNNSRTGFQPGSNSITATSLPGSIPPSRTTPTISSISPNSEYMKMPIYPGGGSTITVQGAHFVSGASVSIGGLDCPISDSSTVSITCVSPTPVTAGSYNLVVTNPDSGSATVPNGYTYSTTLVFSASTSEVIAVENNINNRVYFSSNAGGNFQIGYFYQSPPASDTSTFHQSNFFPGSSATFLNDGLAPAGEWPMNMMYHNTILMYRLYGPEVPSIDLDTPYLASVTITAFYKHEAGRPNLYYYAGVNGSVSGNTAQTDNSPYYGDTGTAVADAGYHFVRWSDNSTQNPRADLAVTTDISVEAIFASDQSSSNNVQSSATVQTPDPAQQSHINSMNPVTGVSGVATQVVLSGLFGEPITNISINGIALPTDSWKQSASAVSLIVPSGVAGKYSIQIFNASAPSLAPKEFTYIDAPVLVATVSPVAPAVTTAGGVPAPTTPVKSEVKLKPLKNDVKLNFYFDMGSYSVKGESLKSLKSLAGVMKGLGKQITVTITGFAQPTPGSEATDGELSRRRAAEVAKILRANGVTTRVTYLGAGRASLNVPASRYVELIAANS